MLCGRIKQYLKYVCVLVAQSHPTLCDAVDCGHPGSSLHGILQARILEWVAISSPGDILDRGKPGSPALQVILYCLSHQGNPSEIQQELNVFLLAQGLITGMKGIWDLLSNRINWGLPTGLDSISVLQVLRTGHLLLVVAFLMELHLDSGCLRSSTQTYQLFQGILTW